MFASVAGWFPWFVGGGGAAAVGAVFAAAKADTARSARQGAQWRAEVRARAARPGYTAGPGAAGTWPAQARA